MRVVNPAVELLAIKLYEHDHQGQWPLKYSTTSWMALDEEDRELFREIARGERDMPTPETKP